MNLQEAFLAVDRRVNALCGGDPKSTISARVGYFSKHYRSKGLKRGRYWRLLEKVINYAFKPLDGPGHCQMAMEIEGHERYKKGNDVARALMAWVVIGFCLPASLLFRLAVRLNPSWGPVK
jgi:hypothetical protein